MGRTEQGRSHPPGQADDRQSGINDAVSSRLLLRVTVREEEGGREGEQPGSEGGSGSRVECRGKGGQGPNHATVCSAGAAWAAGSIGAGVCPIAAALRLDGDAAVMVVAEEEDRSSRAEPPGRIKAES